MKLFRKLNKIFLIIAGVVVAVGLISRLQKTIVYGLNLSLFDWLDMGTSIIPFLLFMAWEIFKRRTIRFLFIGKLSHILSFFMLSLVIIWFEGYSSFAVGFYMIGNYLSFNYGFMEKHFKSKIITSGVFLFFWIEFCGYLNGNGGFGISSLIYAGLFMGIIYLCEKEIISKLLVRQQILEQKYRELKGHYLPLDSLLTQRELEVARVLYSTRATDDEIAFQLGISRHTVVNHMRRLRDKLNASSRQALIENIRGFFSAEENSRKVISSKNQSSD